jgi:hypothetical protein
MHTFTKNGLPAEKKGRYPLDLRLSQSATLVRITGGCRQARLLTSLGGAVRYYQTICTGSMDFHFIHYPNRFGIKA